MLTNHHLLSIIIPTYNEERNIRPLVKEIVKTFQGSACRYELIFVDDSADQTPHIIAQEATLNKSIRLIHRFKPEQRGLASALLHGFAQAQGTYVCCLDADLQHPPQLIPALLKKIISERADIVVASRYIDGGNTQGLTTFYRKFASRFLKHLVHLIFTETRVTSDPGSGFFVFRKTIIQDVLLQPKGFKILLEILMRARYRKLTEVPYQFLPRYSDKSKATLVQGIEFFKHVWHLMKTIPHAARFIKFCIVGANGVLVNVGTLFILVQYGGLDKTSSWLIAVALSILTNFYLNTIFTFPDRIVHSFNHRLKRLVSYYGVSTLSLGVNFILYRLGLSLGLHYLIASLGGIVAATVLNFIFASRLIWKGSFSSQRQRVQRQQKFPYLIITGASIVILSAMLLVISGKANALTLFVIMLSLALSAQGIFSLFLMLYAWEDPQRAQNDRSPTLYQSPLYSFSALIPARHEEEVIGDTLRAMARIRYPEALKEVIVICRSDDTKTILAAKHAIRSIKKNIRLVVFDDSPINKSHSLNIGLQNAGHDIVAVFDAEDEPHEDIYQIINTLMLREDPAVVQSGVQLMNYRSSWFATFNIMEYFFWYKSALHFFSRLKLIPLGGNTVFFKKIWLQYIGGWDEQCLTEDADMGIRLSVAGAKIRVVYDEAHVTKEETPPTLGHFIRQRTRWSQGFIQVLFKGDWLKLPHLHQQLLALCILSWPLVQFGMFIFFPISLIMLFSLKLPVLVAILSNFPLYILFLHLVVYDIGLYEFTKGYNLSYSFWLPLKTVYLFYPFQLVLGFSALRAIKRIIRGEREWEKTLHINAHRSPSLYD